MASIQRSRPSNRTSDDNLWDASLLGLSSKSAVHRPTLAEQAFGGASHPQLNQSVPPLLLSSNTKLLAPLTGVFIALLIFAGWQIGADDLVSTFTINRENLKTGHAYLGAVGATMADSLVKSLNPSLAPATPAPFEAVVVPPDRRSFAGRWLAQAAGSSLSIMETMRLSGQAFFQGVRELLTLMAGNLKRVITEADRVLVGIVIFLQNIFQSLYYSVLAGIDFLADRLEMLLDDWLPPPDASAATGRLANLNQTLITWFGGLTETITNWWQTVKTAWLNFLSPTRRGGWLIDEEVKADVKEIKRDVKTLLYSSTRESAGRGGLIVVPSTGNDQTLKERLTAMFSDPVAVEFDPDGRTGIITPTFEETSGERYIFLLAPINQP